MGIYAGLLKKDGAKIPDHKKQDENEQLSLILDTLRVYYAQDDGWVEINKTYHSDVSTVIPLLAIVSDAPALDIKILAEIYDKDFWTLWDSLKGTAEKKFRRSTAAKVKPVTTLEFLKINPDDMILFWKDNGEIVFSDSLQDWFKDLRSQYDQFEKKNFIIKEPLKWKKQGAVFLFLIYPDISRWECAS